MTRNVYLDLSYAFTDETIQATRQWFADNAQQNIDDVLDGTVMPSWPSRYVAHQEHRICEAYAGELDNTLGFLQRAYFIQTGEYVQISLMEKN